MSHSLQNNGLKWRVFSLPHPIGRAILTLQVVITEREEEVIL